MVLETITVWPATTLGILLVDNVHAKVNYKILNQKINQKILFLN
jgi:hypothetical protein